MTEPGDPRELERVRLAALHSYEVLDTPPEREFDDLARLAAQTCQAPMALVSLVDADRQWFKARVGFNRPQTPIAESICAVAMRHDGVFAVSDARLDDRLAQHPLVTGEPHVRFYAGMPLVTEDGLPLGTLCVMDTRPRQMTAEQQQALQALGTQVMSQLELRRTRSTMQRAMTEWEQTGRTLREHEELMTRLVEGSQDCIKVLDLDGRLLSMNAGGMKVLEICDFEPYRNLDWPELWPQESRATVRGAVETARRGGIGRFAGFCPTAMGTPRWWDVAVNAIQDAGGQPYRLLAVSRDITERRRAEELLKAVTEGTAASTGGSFYSSLVRYLAQALQVRRVFVAECIADDRARARAVWLDNEYAQSFEYAVAGTPCEKVVQGETCLWARNVRDVFPTNRVLAQLNAQSYLGVPLFASNRRVIGHMVVTDDKPMSEDPLWLSVLQTFAARAGVELEREQADARLHEALAEVERLKNQLHAENVYLQEEIRREHNFEEMVGNGPALVGLLRKVELVAETDATVLIHGETGTGKELIARGLHSSSPRRQRPLVKVNCGAIPPSLIESELFGHVKGAFTGAFDRRIGRFELADGGTLFLDEIGELPLDTQVKLLRVLQEREFEPVGGSRTVRVDVRIIAATNRDLAEEVRAGRFRSDLFFRLNVVPLSVPPLRERREDIPLLVTFFVSRFAKQFGRRVDGVTRETMERLTQYGWPGNVRELQNVIERAVVLAQGPYLTLNDDWLPVAASRGQSAPAGAARDDTERPSTAGTERRAVAADRPVTGETARTAPETPVPRAAPPSGILGRDEAERRHIEQVLAQTGWVIEGPSGAAQLLKLHPNTLRSRMKRLGLRRPGHEIS